MVATLFFCGCQNENQKQLQQLIGELNAECPIPLGAIGQMDNAKYANDVVTFNYTLAGSVDINSFRNKGEQFHQFMLDNYRTNSDEGFRQLLQAIVAADASLDVVFGVEGDSYKLHFTNEELSQNVPSFVGDPETYLQSALQTTRMQLPLTYSEGVVCTNVELDSHYFTYYFDCDEALLSIADMQRSVVENHEGMKEMITSSSDPSFIKMMNMLKETHRGLRYRYQGSTTGEVAEVAIEADEL